jgi:hypothetical protein
MKRVIFELEYLRGVPFHQMSKYFIDGEKFPNLFDNYWWYNDGPHARRISNINIINTPTIQGEVK